MAQDDPFYEKPLTRHGNGGRSNVAPYRPLDGAADGNRGATVILPSPEAGSSVAPTIVETPKKGGSEAEVMTVTMGMEFNGQETGYNPALPCNVICNLEWGMGGAAFHASLDWVQGGAFSLPASYIRVGATYSAVPLGFIGALPPDVILSAGIAYGAVSDQANVRAKRLTSALPLALLPAATENINVPRWARTMSIVAGLDNAGLNDAAILVTFVSGIGAGQYPLGAFRFENIAEVIEVPVPNGAWMAIIKNIGSAPFSLTQWGSIIWGLGF
jgi:hypothetical protein